MSTFRFDLFGAVGSNVTSDTYLTADAEEMSLQPIVPSATTLTVQGSNTTGFRSTIAEADWSTLTVLASMTTNDMVNIEPGFRWLRTIRESAVSCTAAYLAGRNSP